MARQQPRMVVFFQNDEYHLRLNTIKKIYGGKYSSLDEAKHMIELFNQLELDLQTKALKKFLKVYICDTGVVKQLPKFVGFFVAAPNGARLSAYRCSSNLGYVFFMHRPDGSSVRKFVENLYLQESVVTEFDLTMRGDCAAACA